MGFHYTYGGSTIKRTKKCPGWKALGDYMPKQKGSKAADDGSLYHEACELLWNEPDTTTEQLMALTYNDSVMTQEALADKVFPAYEALLDLLEQYDVDTDDDAVCHAELQVQYDSEIGGTCDFCAINKAEDTVILADYKFGDGIMVDVENNDQCNFYGWCWTEDEKAALFAKYPHVEKVIFAIIQPSERKEKLLDIWETTVDALKADGDVILDAIDKADEARNALKGIDMKEAYSVDSPALDYLCSGDHCVFCPAEALCPVKTAKAQQAMRIDVSDDSDFVINHLAEALEMADELESWCKSVKAFGHMQDEQGVKIPGWKRVAKRATASWADEDVALKMLKRILGAKAATKVKPITPAVARKEFKAAGKELDETKYCKKESSGTNFVRESAKGEAVISVAAMEAALAQSL